MSITVVADRGSPGAPFAAKATRLGDRLHRLVMVVGLTVLTRLVDDA
ncbi:MAG: hypothetical protein K0V04_27010 [Deltaproteobacteria bacterium]|nr:hypothetical protein [Deltaproteobacteria bacterium]